MGGSRFNSGKSTPNRARSQERYNDEDNVRCEDHLMTFKQDAMKLKASQGKAKAKKELPKVDLPGQNEEAAAMVSKVVPKSGPANNQPVANSPVSSAQTPTATPTVASSGDVSPEQKKNAFMERLEAAKRAKASNSSSSAMKRSGTPGAG